MRIFSCRGEAPPRSLYDLAVSADRDVRFLASLGSVVRGHAWWE
jgi:hypothetical protein